MKEMCVKAAKPLFFVFDECGSLSVDDLSLLRNSCRFVWEFMNAEELMTCYPFFYFCGRGTAYNELGTEGSPVGSHWLTLQPLEPEHVKTILQGATKHGKDAFTFHKGLSVDELDRLVGAVIDWTAGAPRPLLYAFSLIEQCYLDQNVDIKSADGLEKLFHMLVKYVKSKPDLINDLGSVGRRSSSELTADEKIAYQVFIECHDSGLVFGCLGELNNKLKLRLSDKTGAAKSDMYTYLRSINVFIRNYKDGTFSVVVPRFVKMLLRADGDI